MAELETQLLSKIDRFSPRKYDAVQLEKVHRYVYFVRLLIDMKQELAKTGLMVEVHNGQQHFIKSNSLIKDIAQISNQLLAIEKTFDFEISAAVVDQVKNDKVGGLL